MINHGIEWGFPIIFHQPSLLAGASKQRWRFAVFSIVAYASIDNSVAWDVEVTDPLRSAGGTMMGYVRTGGSEFLIYVA